MISPEQLRRYQFFGRFTESHLRALSMITDEINFAAGTYIFEEGKPASNLYLLKEGGVDLTYKSEESFHPKVKKVFPVGEVNPGEIFGISAVVEPYIYNASANAAQECVVLRIDSQALRAILDSDYAFAYQLMHQVAKATLERLAYTRVQLAAAWA